ncbi:ABC transporter ATP-binding protein [Mitsuokella sp. AF21-1AC]|jgi:heme exporter protein A|uniref:ABC transporter ATP-binding protein n=1 Tax=Mitsuokella sp. AF21-1AC TaxID=2292235 RepID=UPI001F2AAB90|nr:ABC transporter ATP-binding protein [Mitsuokella sp. AF21-1AC]
MSRWKKDGEVMVHITFDDVTQRFRGRTIFEHVSRDLPGGQVTAVTGANGSGKSTMLKLAAHLLQPSSGAVCVTEDGKELRRAELRARLAMVTPELRFYARLTAWENARFLLGLRGIRLTRERFRELLERVELPERAVRASAAGEFSTGMQQRLKLAVLLASDVPVWLLDEPGANLDEAGRSLVRREMRQAAAAGRLVFLATNDGREEGMADERIHLSGR